MSRNERIEALEQKVFELEARLAAQEARAYYPHWSVIPPQNNWPTPYWTTFTTTTGGSYS